MILGKITGSAAATEKNHHYKGLKTLLVRPIHPDGSAAGPTFLAVDAVQAGPGDRVLVIDEGGSAKIILQRPQTGVIRCVIAGIVDEVDYS